MSTAGGTNNHFEQLAYNYFIQGRLRDALCPAPAINALKLLYFSIDSLQSARN